jgi:tRNA/rRNA methyltransferase
MGTVCFILVRPQVPQNVGAAARAIKTMGFSELRIVNSTAHKKDQAQWLAHGAADVLDNAAAYASLADALSDCDFAVGTTARRRGRRADYLAPEALCKILAGKGKTVRRAAIVFGPEEAGLSNEEIDLCDIVSSIPMKTRFPSLNLGQAVMLYAYVLSGPTAAPPADARPGKNESSQQALMKEKAGRLLVGLGLGPGDPLYRRVMDRLALVKGIDVRLAHSVINKTIRKSEMQ